MRGARKRLRRRELPSTSHSPIQPLTTRELNEQQAALNITALAARAVDFQARNQVPNLINTLLVSHLGLHVNMNDVSTNFMEQAQASDEVIGLIAQADATNLERGRIQENDKVSLMTLSTVFATLLKETENLRVKDTDVQEKAKEEPRSSPPTVAATVEDIDGSEKADGAKNEHDDTDMLLN